MYEVNDLIRKRENWIF